MPVSLTEHTRPASAAAMWTSTDPSGVNFTAFEIRL